MFQYLTRAFQTLMISAAFLALAVPARAQDAVLAPASLAWNTVPLGQTSSIQQLKLTNTQAVPLKISGVALPLGSDFVQTATTCPMAMPSSTGPTLAPGASCNFSVAFRPLAAGARTSRLTVFDDAPSRMQQVSLSGTGVIGAALFSPTSMSFPRVAIGTTSVAQAATLIAGSGDITIKSITASAQFSVSQSCPAVLKAGTSCPLSVAFSPRSSGYPTGYVSVSYTTSSGVNAAQQLWLDGSTPSSFVSITPSSFEYGAVGLGSGSDKVFTLTNNFMSAVTLGAMSNSAADYAVVASTCPASPNSLAVNASCEVTVRFSPQAAVASTDRFSVASSAPDSPSTATLSGTGVSNVGLMFNPAALSWGSVQMGQVSGAKTITVTNSNSGPVTISSLTSGNEFTINASTCPVGPSSLAAGASCTISVSFRPMAQGPRSDALTVVNDASSTPQTVPLSGNGIIGPLLFSPTSLTFTTTAAGQTSATQTATLTNTTSASIDLMAITHTNAFPETSNCVPALAPGASCTFTVAFAPMCSGAKSGTVRVYTAKYATQLYLFGTATGTSICPQPGPPNPNTGLSFAPGRVLFGTQTIGTSTTQQITATNYQTQSINISSIAVAAPFSQTNNCAATLPEGFSCIINITYTPTAAGYANAMLTVVDSGTATPQSVPLTGNAANPFAVTPRNSSLAFNSQMVGTSSSPQAVTISNNQAVPLRILSITGPQEFPYSSTCGDAIPAGASCTINVTFTPQVAGTRTGTLTIGQSASSTPISIALYGTAVNSVGQSVMVTVGPYNPCVAPAGTLQFSAQVTNVTNPAVTWYVDGVANGNARVGTITSSGFYTAPATTGSHTVKAVSVQSPASSGRSLTTITTTPSFTVYPYTASLTPGASQSFQALVCSNPDTNAVSYTVDGIAGGNATVGTITSTGEYHAPATAGKHTVRVTDSTIGKSTSAVATVFSSITADFGSRTYTAFPVPSELFGAGRGEAIHNASDATLLPAAGLLTARVYANIPGVFATSTPDWSKIDGLMASMQTAGIRPLLQVAYSPVWLQPTSGSCGNSNAPTNVQAWAQIAQQYVAHLDAKFPGFVRDYEIWNEPNAFSLCGTANKLSTYLKIYAAAAPLMKSQAAADGAAIRVGGPALSNYSSDWIKVLLTTASTAPYVDFVSYHQYLFGETNLNVQWDTYTGNMSMYQRTQDVSNGVTAIYNKVEALAQAGMQPSGAKLPIYIDEFNTNWAFAKDCCRNDPTYAPLWNALYVTDALNSVYNGAQQVPQRLVYFAANAYPYFCLFGTQDSDMDCQYSNGSTPQPYPQYFTYQLLSSSKYLGLSAGGFMAKSVTPNSTGGGPVVTAFYNASQDAILITNPTATNYGPVAVVARNAGLNAPEATLYTIVNGASINSSSIALTQSGSDLQATVDVPPYSVQAISLRSR